MVYMKTQFWFFRKLTLLMMLFSIKGFSQTYYIKKVAGITAPGFSGDGGLAVNSAINYPIGQMCGDSYGNIYFTDRGNHRVRKIDTNTGIITTVAGTGVLGFYGDGGPADSAQFFYPIGVVCDHAGNLYVNDADNNRIRRIDAQTHIITTICNLGVTSILNIAVDPYDNLYITTGSAIYKVDVSTGQLTHYAGQINFPNGDLGEGGLATDAYFTSISQMAFDKDNNMIISDGFNNIIRKIDHNTNIITTIAGNYNFSLSSATSYNGDQLPDTSCAIGHAGPLLVDSSNTLIFGAEGLIRKVNSQDGRVYSIAGNSYYSNGPNIIIDNAPGTSQNLGGIEDLFYYNNEIYFISGVSYNIYKLTLNPNCPNFSFDRQVDSVGVLSVTPHISPNIGSPSFSLSIKDIYETEYYTSSNTYTCNLHCGNNFATMIYADTINGNICYQQLTSIVTATASNFPSKIYIYNLYSPSSVNTCSLDTFKLYASVQINDDCYINSPSQYTLTVHWNNSIADSVIQFNHQSISNFSIIPPPIYTQPGTYTIKSTLNIGTDTMSMYTNVNINICGTVTGTVFVDNNGNCTLETSEPRVSNIQVKIKNSSAEFFTWTDTMGVYTMDVPPGVYSIETETVSPGYIINCSNSLTHNVMVISGGNGLVTNFALNCSGIDLGVEDILPNNQLFPGEQVVLFPFIKNKNKSCFSNDSALLKIVLPPCLTYINNPLLSNVPDIVTNPSGDTLIWTINNIQNINEYGYLFSVNTCTTAQTGDSALIKIFLSLSTTDPDQANNYFEKRLPIGVSYDPNNKSVNPEGIGDEGNIPKNTSELEYTVNFQNTGNATAHNIFLLDTISSNLEVNSLKVLSSSHAMNTYYLGNNVVKFSFPNIMLPDSSSNSIKSHGYVKYKIRLKANLPLETQLKNTAYIYFDYNNPVQTNTTLNTISSILSVQDYSMKKGLLYPNPFNQIIHVRIEKESQGILKIKDILGKEVYSSPLTKPETIIDLAFLNNGLYIVSVVTPDYTITSKMLKTH